MNATIPEQLKQEAIRLRMEQNSAASMRVADFACYVLTMASVGAGHLTIDEVIQTFINDRAQSCLSEWTELFGNTEAELPDGEPIRHA